MVNVNPNFKEIVRLHEILDEFGVNHKFERVFDGYRVSTRYGSAVESSYSYGHSDDLMELRGFGMKNGLFKSFINADDASDYFIIAEGKNGK